MRIDQAVKKLKSVDSVIKCVIACRKTREETSQADEDRQYIIGRILVSFY